MKQLIATGISLLIICSMALGQERLNLDEQIAQARTNMEELEQVVCTTVESHPDRAAEVVAAFIRAFPELAEEITFTGISCLPSVSEEVVGAIVQQAILAAPGMAEAIVFGARRATDESFHDLIDQTAQRTIREAIAGGLRPFPSSPGVDLDGSILSPARDNDVG